MDESEIIEEKKKYNAPFFRAFDHLAKDMGKNQQEMALHIGASPSLISDQRNGKKRVGEKYMTNLANAFNEFYRGEAHLYMKFLQGKSQYMLVENVPDSEISENLSREANPDYDVMKAQQQQASVHDQDLPLMMSKTYESILKPIEAAHAQQVASLNHQVSLLEQQLADKNHQIATLEQDKEELRMDKESLNRRVRELESRLFQYESGHKFDNFPFPQGVAEKDDINSTRV